MENLKVTDSFEELISKMKESLFDIFVDYDNESIYFSDGLDVGYIRNEEQDKLVIGIVLRTRNLIFSANQSYPISALGNVIDRGYYPDSENKEFYTGATEWLKQNGKLKLLGKF